jgi:hypothetical protein
MPRCTQVPQCGSPPFLPSTSALMTLPSALRDRLILVASLRRSPGACTRSVCKRVVVECVCVCGGGGGLKASTHTHTHTAVHAGEGVARVCAHAPVAPVLLCRSLPARSTRLSLPTRMWPSCGRGHGGAKPWQRDQAPRAVHHTRARAMPAAAWLWPRPGRWVWWHVCTRAGTWLQAWHAHTACAQPLEGAAHRGWALLDGLDGHGEHRVRAAAVLVHERGAHGAVLLANLAAPRAAGGVLGAGGGPRVRVAHRAHAACAHVRGAPHHHMRVPSAPTHLEHVANLRHALDNECIEALDVHAAVSVGRE